MHNQLLEVGRLLQINSINADIGIASMLAWEDQYFVYSTDCMYLVWYQYQKICYIVQQYPSLQRSQS